MEMYISCDRKSACPGCGPGVSSSDEYIELSLGDRDSTKSDVLQASCNRNTVTVDCYSSLDSAVPVDRDVARESKA